MYLCYIDESGVPEIGHGTPPREEAFTQVVDRFERYLAGIGGQQTIGLLAHDHNDTSAARLTQLMRQFHASGTMWTRITHIIETPFFVDSGLTVGVQLADLCAYAIRRFCENGESDLFNRIYPRAHRVAGHAVGVRHYTSGRNCVCTICANH
jgi:hypothetical protein